MILHCLGPRLLAICEIPLISRSYNTFIICTRDDTGLGFKVQVSLSSCDHFVLDLWFGYRYLLSGIGTDLHYSRSESLQVSFILSLSELGFIIRTLNLQLLAHEDSGGIAIALNLDNWNNLEIINHIRCNVKLGCKVRFILKRLECHVIIRSITRNRCHNSSSLIHTNGQKWKRVHFLVACIWRFKWQSKKFIPRKGLKAFDLSKLLGEIRVLTVHLTGESTSRSCTHDENLISCVNVVGSIFAVGKDETVGLSIHCLGAESSRYEVDSLFVILFQECFHLVVPCLSVIGLQHLQFDQHILLRANSLAFASIVISTDLTIYKGEDIVSFSKQNLPLFIKYVELPTDKRIVVWVDKGSNERTTPIYTCSEMFHMFNTNRWEVVEPVKCVYKLRDFFLWNHLHKNVPLTNYSRSGFTDKLGFASLCFTFCSCICCLGSCCCCEISLHFCTHCGVILRELRWNAIRFNF
mmetsp:Transcript_25411/g.37671  ORF Transcript_25411/g.37671 Transcript_25411/m.37671 type:complete len:466 (-) Transcript_25411:367-1764(-)